jgi:hypothetical protein
MPLSIPHENAAGSGGDKRSKMQAIRSRVVVVTGCLIFAGMVGYGVYRQEYGEVLLNAVLL